MSSGSQMMDPRNNVRKRVNLFRGIVREGLEHGARSRQLVGDVEGVAVGGVWVEMESPHSMLPLEGLGQHSIYCPPQHLAEESSEDEKRERKSKSRV